MEILGLTDIRINKKKVLTSFAENLKGNNLLYYNFTNSHLHSLVALMKLVIWGLININYVQRISEIQTVCKLEAKVFQECSSSPISPSDHQPTLPHPSPTVTSHYYDWVITHQQQQVMKWTYLNVFHVKLNWIDNEPYKANSNLCACDIYSTANRMLDKQW